MIVPVWEKQNLTIEEAVTYSNIGQKKLRQLSDDEQ
nr:excisionase [uncultured Gemmiger sp.]